MSIANFSQLLQDKIYKDWLAKVEKNIVTVGAKGLRSSQEVAKKTSFYITEKTLKQMYKTITGTELDDLDAQVLLEDLRNPDFTSDKKSGSGIEGTYVTVAGSRAVFFESIGFDTISEKLNAVLNTLPEVQFSYEQAEERFFEKQLAELKASAKYQMLKPNEKQKAIDDLQDQARARGTLGYYYNKGHVVAVATNLARQFRDEISKANVLADKQRDLLLQVLDQYIDKLVQDDLATANLPNAVSQEMYARYIKSSDKYLVEMQLATGNIQAGQESRAIIDELRKVFGGKLAEQELVKILSSSEALHKTLLTEKGSPSVIDLMRDQIIETLKTGKHNKKVYTSPKTKVASTQIQLKKPKSKKQQITKLKKLRQQVASVKPNPNQVVVKTPTTDTASSKPETNLLSLQNLLNQTLVEQVKRNMGKGERKDILNLRTGRFAESVKVERLTESRQGMITAFYSYMKNPYATFSEGGKQQFPRSRDPKLLISRSIRDLATQQITNRLRAVAV